MVDILIVDNNEVDGIIFQEALQEVSPKVTTLWVASGEQAIALLFDKRGALAPRPVKLVVMDLNMPGLGGIETLRQIRKSAECGSLPVLLLSSSKAKADVDRAYRFGANAFIAKPLDFQAYVDRVRILVRHWLELAELPSVSFARSAAGLERNVLPREEM